MSLFILYICGILQLKGHLMLQDSKESFDAIKDLHAHLDDDHDGNINTEETADYMKTELEDNNDVKQKSFHSGDSNISVEDLWAKWKQSDVFKWSTDEIIIWLVDIVKLPQYEKLFRNHRVNGTNIPRLATPSSKYVQQILSINDNTHRKKIYLRASDALLFGVPDGMKKIEKKEVVDKNFLAIQAVHAHLDDDSDGIIDMEESVEYVTDELKSKSIRHTGLHYDDPNISVDELWEHWVASAVFNWTTDEVVSWLNIVVGLPQYETNFKKMKITGKSIPRLANDTLFYKELGIDNAKDRKKISLRASDVILFGPPDVQKNYFSDTIVCIIILLSTLAFIYTITEKSRTKRMIERMSKDMEALQQVEDKFKSMQIESCDQTSSDPFSDERERKLLEEIENAKKEADRLRTERSKNQEEKLKLTLVEEELSEVRIALAKAEIEMKAVKFRTPAALQEWLKISYQNETKYFQYRKQAALNQMNEAKDACDKVSKSRRSMLGSFRLVHSQSIDLVDQKILKAKSALAEVTNDLQERQNRWKQIEMICNFPIIGDTLSGNSDNVKVKRRSVCEVIAEIGSIGVTPISKCEIDTSDTELINSFVTKGDRDSIKSFTTKADSSMDLSSIHSDIVTQSDDSSLNNHNSSTEAIQTKDVRSDSLHISSSASNIPSIEENKVIQRCISEKDIQVIINGPPQAALMKKSITRANTEPNNMVNLGNDKTIKKEKDFHRPISPLVGNVENIPSSSNLIRVNGVSNSNPNIDYSETEEFSDESISSVSSITKNKKKFKKLFSKKSKKEK